MIKYLCNGIGTAALGGIIPKGLPGYDYQIGHVYDPNKVRKYVREYIRQSKAPPMVSLMTNANYLDLCEYIQGELAKIGLEIKIDVMPTSSLLEARANGKLAFFRTSWIADYPDAENYLALFYSKNFSPNGNNATHYNNPKFDRWYETALNTRDPEKRKQLYKRMDHLMMQTAPIIPLLYDQVILFVKKNVKGLHANPTNLLQLKSVYKE